MPNVSALSAILSCNVYTPILNIIKDVSIREANTNNHVFALIFDLDWWHVKIPTITAMMGFYTILHRDGDTIVMNCTYLIHFNPDI
jgi:hypothetical protein